jgi:hypothetical protein
MTHISEIIEDILVEWAYRVHDGMPNPKNTTHIQQLRESMKELNLPNKVIYEVIQNLINEEDDDKYVSIGYGRYKEKGKEKDSDADVYVKDDRGKYIKSADQKSDDEKPKAKQTKIDANPFDKKDGEKDSDEDKPTKTDTQVPAQRIFKNEAPMDFENDSIEDISSKISKGEFKETTTEQARQQSKDNRAKVFSGEKVGKGGTDTTAQEEMAGMANELGFQNENMTDEEIEDAIIKEIKEKYPDSKYAINEERSRELARKSTGGFKTAKEIMTNPKADYNENQPDGYPDSTTEINIVKNALLTKYKEAKEAGDEDKIKHYQEELKLLQEKGADKSITGKEGDADKFIMYFNNNGDLMIHYTTNKQSEKDMLSNATISTVTKATEASAVEGADITAVTRVQRDAMETGKGFNERYVKNSQEIIKNNRKDLKEVGDIIGKITMYEGGRSEYHDGKKPNLSYFKDNLKNKGVQERLKQAGVDVEDAKKNPEKYSNEIMQAGLDSHGTDVEGIGTGAQGVAYATVKATKATKKIRDEMKKCMGGDESRLKGCAEKISKQPSRTDKNKILFGGKLSGDDVVRIMNSKGLEELEEEQATRQKSMDGMYEESVNRLREIDIQYYIDEEGLSEEDAMKKMETTPGPNEQSYTAGFLNRTHMDKYITGKYDGRVSSEMGTNSHSPKTIRKALANIIGYDGDIDNGEEFLQYTLENVRADHENQTLTFINEKDESVEIGKDTHRLAGRNEKMAGAYGDAMVKELKKLGKEE